MKRYIFLILIVLFNLYSLSAREVIPLLDNWYFYPSSARTTDGAQRISLPHTWSVGEQPSGVHGSMGNYVRKLNLSPQWRDKRIFIKFYGVNNIANLLVNGEHAGEHYGAYTAFTFEITEQLRWDIENELQLVVNGAQLTSLPPTSIDYEMECGIYRPVELIVTPKAAVSPLYYGSEGIFVSTKSVSDERATGDVKVILSTYSQEKMDLTLSIYEPNGERAFVTTQKSIRPTQSEVSVPFEISSPAAWSPSSPSLYRFSVELSTPKSSDSVEVWSGLRVISTDEVGRVKINSQEEDIRGVLLYHDNPLVGNALCESEIESDMELVREVGATAIRSSVAPHHHTLYDYCDSEGLLVWIDFPISRTPYLADIAYYPTADYHRNADVIAHEIVAQNYNHPSVVMWGLFSQLRDRDSGVVEFLTSLRDRVKSFDTTRLIAATSNQNGDINALPDLIVWRQNLGWYRGDVSDISLWRGAIHDRWGHFKSGVAYGESGSIYNQNMGRASNFTTSATTTSSTQLFDRNQPNWSSEAAMTKLHEEYAPQLLGDSLFWGVWLCNMFDYKSHRSGGGENSSGLVSFDRRSRKDIFYLYKSQWNAQEPTLHIAGRREWRRGAKVSDLKIYASSSESIEVLLNGADTLSVTPQGAGIHLVAPFELKQGVNTIEAMQGVVRDSITLSYTIIP